MGKCIGCLIYRLNNVEALVAPYGAYKEAKLRYRQNFVLRIRLNEAMIFAAKTNKW